MDEPKNEREAFGIDLWQAGDDFNQVSDMLYSRNAWRQAGWFRVLGSLVQQLSLIVSGDDRRIELTDEELKLACKAYTVTARTFQILKMRKETDPVIPERARQRLLPFGKMLPVVWGLIPGREQVDDVLPDIMRKDNPAWKLDPRWRKK